MYSGIFFLTRDLPKRRYQPDRKYFWQCRGIRYNKPVSLDQNGNIAGKRGRRAKYNKDHKDYVLALAKANPFVTNKCIRNSEIQYLLG